RCQSRLPPPLVSPIFPYTTLFRSLRHLPPVPHQSVRCGRCTGPVPLARHFELLEVSVIPYKAKRRRVPVQGERAKLQVASDLREDRKSTRLNSSHSQISYADFCLK